MATNQQDSIRSDLVKPIQNLGVSISNAVRCVLRAEGYHFRTITPMLAVCVFERELEAVNGIGPTHMQTLGGVMTQRGFVIGALADHRDRLLGGLREEDFESHIGLRRAILKRVTDDDIMIAIGRATSAQFKTAASTFLTLALETELTDEQLAAALADRGVRETVTEALQNFVDFRKILKLVPGNN